MVALDKVLESNAQIAKTYPEGLVAVFAGATSGIGEIALRNFVQHTTKPRVYVIGRSQEACARIDIDLKTVNPGGEYIFMRSDLSLIRNVDDICNKIMAKEAYINVLFMSQGTLNLNKSMCISQFIAHHLRGQRLLYKCMSSISFQAFY